MIGKAKSYIEESRQELKRVNWPSKQETVRLTVIVILVSLFTAVFLGLADFLFKAILTKILI